uniref:C2H2-type domain-containing protein n=1 Tax=Oryza punctata TaxID=4537 RepID=A0A0E0M1C6_ORYPU
MDFTNDGHFADAPSHGDSLMVVRDALLSQLQQDRLRKDIIVAELAMIERAMALRVASPSPTPTPLHGAAAGNTAATEITPPKKPSPSEKSEPAVQMPMPPSAWSCAVCQVRTTSERNLRDHCGGQKHQSKVAALEKKTKAMAKTTAKPSPGAGQNTHIAAERWGCSICHISCNGEWDFDTHLKGKKHQANTQALLEQSKKNSGNPESKGTRAAATLICRVCQAKFTCQLDLQSHLKVMSHQLNVRATSPDGSSFTSETSESSSLALAMYDCKVCSVKCTSERMLACHLTGKKHLKQEKLQAFCEICKLQCNSEKVLSDHRYGKKHQAKLDKVLQAKLNAKE